MSGSTGAEAQTNPNDDMRNNANDGNNGELEEVNAQMELLMRHSSPIILRDNSNGRQQQSQQGGGSPILVAATTAVERRNSTPSPLRMHRPRSNPRTRTPMRFESPLQQYRINEEEDDDNEATAPNELRNEARRITILPMAGTAVGTTIMTTRIQDGGDGQQRRGRGGQPVGKSRKQGPSHRKIRRWNNDNFVNLAAEINNAKASEVLLKGHAHASKYRSIYTPKISKSMTEFHNNKALSEKFYDGALIEPKPKLSRSHKPTTEDDGREPLSSTTMLNRIDSRLRRVIIKACKNSFAASKVVNMLEKFLMRVYIKGKTYDNKTSKEEWNQIRLLEPPTATYQKSTKTYITKFVFDSNAPTGGFHRLLLHGLCQFHGLKAISSTMEISISSSSGDGDYSSSNTSESVTIQNARLLTASGTFSGSDFKLVDCITKEYGDDNDGDGDDDEDRHVVITTSSLSST